MKMVKKYISLIHEFNLILLVFYTTCSMGSVLKSGLDQSHRLSPELFTYVGFAQLTS